MNPDDPKFTAHALGEVEDLTPVERADIEALLASDATAAAEAGEMRALAARLRAELPGEEAAPLREEQRAAVLRAREHSVVIRPFKQRPWLFRSWIPRSIAATLLISFGLAVLLGIRSYQGLQGVSAVSGISDPRMLELTEFDALAVAVGDAVTGGSVGRNLRDQTSPNRIAAMPALESASKTRSDLNGLVQLQQRERRIEETPVRFALNSPPVPMEAPAPTDPTLAAVKTANLPTPNFGTAVTELAIMPEPPGKASARGTPVPLASLVGNIKAIPQAWMGGSQSTTPRGIAAGGSRIAPVEEFEKVEKVEDLRANLAARQEPANTEAFDAITDNAFLRVRENPLSTFSIDVDTASYAIVRRFLNDNQRPPKGAVRIEELLNYFTYDYPQPQGDAPFSATMEVATCPWAPEHRLVRIGLKGREIAKDKRPASNLVFLIDVSGSMRPENKLPLLKQSLALLIDQLGGEDQVAMVVYAGSSGCVLEPTRDKQKMHAALRKLEAGGSTNGASGIQLAYQLAEKSFIKGGTNRVILATDGDWNVGVTNQSDLLEMITQKAKSGVFLTVMGFGMGNLKDAMLVKLADKGNGNYAYIDTLLEAKKVLVEQLSGTLVTIAKDVKIQVEFNPAHAAAYRLIGYEKRMLAKEDFNNDKKDAGEIGAGHTVTALYEVVPVGKELPQIAQVDALKYQPKAEAPEKPEAGAERSETAAGGGGANQKPETSELLTLKLRYKAPDGDTSKLLEFPLTDTGATWEKSTRDFRFAAAVASYGMLLRDSPHKGNATWGSTQELAIEGKGEDPNGYRTEFLSLIEKAKALTR